MSENLKAGEFYGQVPNNKQVPSAVLSEIIHKKQVDLPSHSHDLACFTLLLDGSYSEYYGRKNFSYSPMTVWWHPSEISHKDEVGKMGGRFFTVEIQQNGLRNLQTFSKVPEIFFERNTSLVWLACRLYHEFKNWQLCSDLVAEGITLEMLAHATRQNCPKEKHPPKWLERVVEKLNDEFPEKMSNDELALEAGVHPVYLAAVFRQFYNETIGEYVQNLRISHASQLLLEEEMPLAEIAYEAGFSDQSHFTRLFKRFVGTTPGAFRSSLQ